MRVPDGIVSSPMLRNLMSLGRSDGVPETRHEISMFLTTSATASCGVKGSPGLPGLLPGGGGGGGGQPTGAAAPTGQPCAWAGAGGKATLVTASRERRIREANFDMVVVLR